MKKFHLLILTVLISFFVGCNKEEELVSSGTQNSTSHIQAMQNIDKNSYAEVADVFLDTQEITTNDKPYFLVFAANGCIFCDKLKTLIKEEAEIKNYIQTNYTPYYINLSYSKEHKIDFMPEKSLSTAELGAYFNIKPTPTMVFLSPKGKILYVYPGFMPKEKFLATLKFLNDKTLENLNEKEIATKIQTALAS
ncbi:hypothetical protein B6S12_08610 [Helicobacter valdiviensis]|uniref:Thioredoxin-like fold domain-containing protein n=1 Tax=Helicobacter valdiviensis TaxID=1458358 RepID=A0A2W6PLJ6_9HELI|nr:thioredoxin family protein [Helicobacter valdiviensis]PZT47523.1 hypothetical protein B6S12_08610 [Helicobacter valdiviensis]